MIGNTWFEKDIHKYTYMNLNDRQQALLVHILIDKCAKDTLSDVNVLSEKVGGISHYLVEVSVDICGGFQNRGNDVG